MKEKLRDEFPEINDAFFENEGNLQFLRIEVNIRNLNDIAIFSKKLSAFLDENFEFKNEYYLDIYSPGTQQAISLDEIGEYIDQNLLIKLKTKIKNKIDYEGKLKGLTSENLIIEWNAKGQFRKQEITLNNIESIALSIKI